MYGKQDKSIGERLDDLVNGTGLYAIVMPNRPEPRNLRVAPAMILVMLAVGYACTAIGFDRRSSSFVVTALGAVLFFGAFAAAGWVRFHGPRIVPDSITLLDERELMLKAKVGSVTGTIITRLTIAGCLYIGFGQYLGWWVPHRLNDWIFLALVIEGWWFTLPVLIASWLQPTDLDEEG